jgi:hypothetical protein
MIDHLLCAIPCSPNQSLYVGTQCAPTPAPTTASTLPATTRTLTPQPSARPYPVFAVSSSSSSSSDDVNDVVFDVDIRRRRRRHKRNVLNHDDAESALEHDEQAPVAAAHADVHEHAKRVIAYSHLLAQQQPKPTPLSCNNTQHTFAVCLSYCAQLWQACGGCAVPGVGVQVRVAIMMTRVMCALRLRRYTMRRVTVKCWHRWDGTKACFVSRV